ncbi:MAG: CpsD/CapB family tyrosine-protein kinase [Acidimicrobiales bacterium]
MARGLLGRQRLFGHRSDQSPWGTMDSFNESFRVLGSNVMATVPSLARPTVMVTSSKAEEGKTVTCAKLAASVAATGRRVIVVDFDLRHPGIHLALGTHNRLGAADVLLGRRRLGECMQYLRLPTPRGFGERGLFLLTAGPTPPQPNEVLALPRTDAVLGRLASQADLVLVDSPPVLAVADALTIGRQAGAALLVVDARRTTAGAVERTRDLLRRNQTRIIGMSLNQVRAGDASVSASYGYGYGNGGVGSPRP